MAPCHLIGELTGDASGCCCCESGDDGADRDGGPAWLLDTLESCCFVLSFMMDLEGVRT